MGDSKMNDVKKLIWDIDKQMRVGAKYYNMFATATQKYTYLMMQLKALDEQKYNQYKQEMEKRFEGVVNGQEATGDKTENADGNQTRPGESASEPNTQLSLNLDSAGDGDGSKEVREPQLESGNEVEPGS